LQTEPQEANKTLPRSLKILSGLLLVMFPVGLVIMFTGRGRQYLWTTTLFLGLQALITFILLLNLGKPFSVIISTVIIFILSYFTEWWGVNTGFPFGYYTYTDVLKPIINGVPLAITFAWFVVSANSLLIIKYFFKSGRGFSAAFIASVLILATDMLLEPFAAFVNNYWSWAANTIPVQNFISWLVLGFVFSLVLNSTLKWNETGFQESLFKIPPFIIAINLLNFTIVNLAYGYIILTCIGLGIFAVITLFSIKFIPNES